MMTFLAYPCAADGLGMSRDDAAKAEPAALTNSMLADIIRQRDLYQRRCIAAEARSVQLEHERSILATRCYQQAEALAKMLERRRSRVVEIEDPIVNAISVMQRNGIR